MNLSRLLISIIAIFVFVSCNDGPSIEPAIIDGSDVKTIVGKWNLEGINVLLDKKAVAVSKTGLEDNYYLNSTFEFKEDESGSFVDSDGEVLPFKFKYDGEKKTLSMDDGEVVLNYTVEFTEAGVSLKSPEIDFPNSLEEEESLFDDFNSEKAIVILTSLFLLDDQDIPEFENFNLGKIALEFKLKK